MAFKNTQPDVRLFIQLEDFKKKKIFHIHSMHFALNQRRQ